MLEPPYLQLNHHPVARASLVLAAGELHGGRTTIWVGGAHSLTGEPLDPSAIGSSWVIDCAGDLDHALRSAVARFLPLVFPDLDGPLSAQFRVDAAVSQAVAAMTSGFPPEHLFVMCTHGMNRSGLVAGLILRGLGLGPRETVERIRAARPGSLSNDHFRLMLLAD